MKDLNTLNTEELQDFFQSFDQILCDVHGVLWNILDKIPGAPAAVNALQKLNKRFIVVSNNTTASLDEYHQQLESEGFDIDKDNIVIPTLAMISYLKKKNFTKQIFVLGTAPLKQSLEEAGFQIAPRAPYQIEETLHALALASSEDDERVGAVIEDIDLNFNYANLQKAATFLQRPDVIFIQGSGDVKFSVGLNRVIIGAGQFHRILQDMTGRTPISMAKPSLYINQYIVEKYRIKDQSRVLFIGDSIPSDMGFATKFGYKKLLVLTGLTKKEALKEWKFPNEHKPDYYVDSLKTLHGLIPRTFKNI